MLTKMIGVFLIGLALFTGCATQTASTATEDKFENRDYEGVVKQNSELDYAKLTMWDLHALCSSLQVTQNFDAFFKCHAVLESKVSGNGGQIIVLKDHDPENAYNKAWTKYDLEMMLAKAYYDLGDFKSTIQHAEQANALANNRLFALAWFDEEAKKRANKKKSKTLSKLFPGYWQQEKVKFESAMPAHQQESAYYLAMSYAKKIQTDQAKRYIQSIKKSTAKPPFNFNDSTPEELRFIGEIYFALGDYQLAKKYLVKRKKIVDRANKILNLYAIVTPYLLMLKPQEALRGLAIILEVEEFNRYSYLYRIEPDIALARVYLETGEIEQARHEYLKLLDDPKFSGISSLHFIALYDLGQIYEQEGDVSKALDYYRQAIELLESQRSTIKSDGLKINFTSNKNAVYSDIVSLLLKQNKIESAFSYVERAKSRALVDLLASKQSFDQTAAPVQSSLAAIKQAELAYDKVKLEGRHQKRGIVSNQYRALQQAAPEVASLISVASPNIKSIQSKLPAKEVLVEYYQSSDELYAFVLTEKGITSTKLSATSLKENVNQYRESLQSANTSDYKQLGPKLYQQLIAPIAVQLPVGGNVTIVPHGVLHYLPFNSIYTGQDFLLDRYVIRVLPSASVIEFLDKAKPAGSSLLALGNPDLEDSSLDLPGAEQEAMAIAKQSANATLLLRAKATETAVKTIGQQFSRLHFASHGIFDEKHPLNSALYLAKDEKNDGKLTVSELFDTKLNAELVTLSACETALGEVSNGDDVVGLTRGFLYAGANTIVSSLWSVDDKATNQLMQLFYQNLKAKDKRSALRQAQLNVKQAYKAHPYYWAAFQLVGAVN